MTTFGNRGKALERTINELFKNYKANGIFCLRIQEARTSTGIIYEKSCFDYLVFHNNKLHAFDAKQINGSAINIKTNLKTHQIDALNIVHHNKGEAFFLIYFTTHKKLTKISIQEVLDIISKGEKSVHINQCTETKLDFLGVL